MSKFDEFFENKKIISIVSRFNKRETITLNHKPLYIAIKEYKDCSQPFLVQACSKWKTIIYKTFKKFYLENLILRLLNFNIILEFEKLIYSNKIIKFEASESEVIYWAPKSTYENFRTLNTNLINYRNGNEPELAHLIDLLIPDDGNFIDVGSNWGYFSFYLFLRKNFCGKIYCYEAMSINFEVFDAIRMRLNAEKNIYAFQMALGNENSEMKFYIHDTQPSTSSSLKKYSTMSTTISTTVQCRTLDSFKFDRVDFLKIDVEGFEAECLSGSIDTVVLHRPYIFIESHFDEGDPNTLRALKILEEQGYQLFLPSWVQNKDTFFVGISNNAEMQDFALTPFESEERAIFGIDFLNVFACPSERLGFLGQVFTDYYKDSSGICLTKPVRRLD